MLWCCSFIENIECVEEKSASRSFFVAVSKSTILLTTKFYEIWRTFLVTLFCLLYSCDGAIGHVKMFDEMFGAFDHPRSNIAKFWLFFQF